MPGSHITKLALAAAMQRLMTEQPFERISVSDICAACGMSRKSFYYHFHDKYDLVGWIFETEFVDPGRKKEFSSSWEFFDALCSYFYAKRAFYVNAFAMRGQNSFAEYFSEFMRPLAFAYFSALFPEDENNAFTTGFFYGRVSRFHHPLAAQPGAHAAAGIRRPAQGGRHGYRV